ncbi:SMP-30/gluconolactonase/LRE family protein [Plastoroseomonas arctica]|uniref:SMP-30/gluconolactonase/LRE family protein n=1 Tax=Plastoroseomonas arctica TaxID=1509237 RepID=A0AAF1K3H3_9PROT|nr:hypothetical protein [Plastoroseomonas arctica]MBR0656073.1 SMP-30/gluconolactonase/LRE family protein [Plastoroseomonas arctica]
MATLAGTAGAQPAPRPLAVYPNGTFLENLILRNDGSVLFTSYFARRIESHLPGIGAAAFAEVDGHPVSLAALPQGGYALAIHGAPFTGGPAALRGGCAVLILDPAGREERRIALPEAIFLNGCLLRADGSLLVVDAALGRIWAVELGGGTVRVWLEDAAFAPDPARPGLPGVNGIKPSLDGASLLVSNSASQSLMSVPLGRAGAPGGPPVPVARFPGIDDFWVMPDGVIWAATHGPAIARLRPGAATPEVFPALGLEGNTALIPAPDGSGLYVLGTGGLAEGGRGEAMLALFPWPA